MSVGRGNGKGNRQQNEEHMAQGSRGAWAGGNVSPGRRGGGGKTGKGTNGKKAS